MICLCVLVFVLVFVMIICVLVCCAFARVGGWVNKNYICNIANMNRIYPRFLYTPDIVNNLTLTTKKCGDVLGGM